MQELTIVQVALTDIKPYKNNAKKHPAEQVANVAESIRTLGWRQPIVLDKDGVIIIGHGRFLAAKQLGLETAPCHYATDLTAEQAKKLRLLDNKLNESEWDFDLLKMDAKGLNFDGYNLEWGGVFDTEEQTTVVEDEIPEVDANAPSITQLGDIWQLGDHRLMCGDSTDILNVNILMQGQKADMVFTDPPYGMNAVSKSGVLSERYKTDIMNDDTNKVAMDAFLLCQQMFTDAKQVWWGANYYTECLPSAECWIVWDKNNGASDQTDCELAWTNFRSVVRQFTLASEKINRVHPTQKPIKLIQQIFNKFDKTNEWVNILDLFGGSGSTLIACEQLGRKCYMMELDPKYCDVIVKRWETLTGQKAVKV